MARGGSASTVAPKYIFSRKTASRLGAGRTHSAFARASVELSDWPGRVVS